MEEIIKNENNRTEDNLKKIFFKKDGSSPWYRAYELSAYYAVHYNNGLKDKERLQATRKSSQFTENGIIQIGLQLASFKKYFPHVEVSNLLESSFSIEIPPNDFSEITLENYKEKYNEWKNGFELKTKDKKQNSKNAVKTVYNNPISFSNIMKEIIRFDTHNKKEDDFRIFINTLKDMCANLI